MPRETFSSPPLQVSNGRDHRRISPGYIEEAGRKVTNHGLENFRDSLYPYERNGRHVGTQTPDLYRVNLRKLRVFRIHQKSRLKPQDGELEHRGGLSVAKVS